MHSVAPLPKQAKPAVWLVCGGPSSEFHVSLASAKSVLLSADFTRFCVRVACLSPEGRWMVAPHAFFSLPEEAVADELFSRFTSPETYPYLLDLAEMLRILQGDRPIVAFNAMHGCIGEDGTVQGLFTMAGVPMTGSGIEASALAMDKVRSRLAFEAGGLRVPRAFTFTDQAGRPWPSGADVDRRVGYPCFVKPVFGGSSLGVTCVRYATDLEPALEAALGEGAQVIIEQGIAGVEVTCGVIEDEHGEPRPLIPTEIRPKAGAFFDFESKYVPGGADEITPARVDPDTLSCIRTAAVMAHKALGCTGYSRADFILTPAQELFILEVNTLPGFTRTSLLPQGAAAMGISFSGLVMRIIAAALRRRTQMPWLLRGGATSARKVPENGRPGVPSSSDAHRSPTGR